MRYRFTFDSMPPTFAVIGWESLTLSYEMQDGRAGVSVSGGLEITEESIISYLRGLGVCESVLLLIEYENAGSSGFEELITLSIPLKKTTYNTQKKTLSISVESFSVLSRAKEEEASKAEIETGTVIALKQPWTWGDLGINLNSVSVYDLLLTVLDRAAPGATVAGSILGPSAPDYAPEIWQITNIPAIVSGDTLTLKIVTAWGDVITCNLESRPAGYTGALAAGFLSLVLNFSDVNAGTVLDWDLNELIAKSIAGIPGGTTLTIAANYPIQGITFTLNGGPSGATVKPTQSFQYSLKNLYLGRTDNEKISISLREIFELLELFQPLIIEDGPEEIKIESFDSAINKSFPTKTVQDLPGAVGAEDKYLKSRALFTNGFLISDYETHLDNWAWKGAQTAVPITAGTTFNYAFAGTAGPYIVSGAPVITNTGSGGVTVTIEVYKNFATLVSTSLPITISSGFAAVESWVQVPFCLAPGDNLSFNVVVNFGAGAQFSGGGTLFLEKVTCFESPGTREDKPQTLETEIPDFATCGGQIESSINSGFYCGLGYAWDQIAAGSQDYEGLTHLAITDGAGALYQFGLGVFFNNSANVCACYQFTTQTYSFANLILQNRYRALNFKALPPAGLEFDIYDIEKTCSPTTVFSETKAAKKTVLFPPHNRRENIKFLSAITPQLFKTVTDEKTINISEVAERSGRAVVKKMSFALGSGIAENEIEL